MIKETSNRRYRILISNNQKYLLDMDSNKMVWYFPWLWSFFSYKIYAVNMNYNGLETTKERRKTNGFVIVLSTIITGFLIRNTSEEFWKTERIDNLSLIILLLVGSIFLLVLLREIQSKQMGKKLSIDNRVKSKKLKIIIENKGNHIFKIILLYFFLLVFLFYFLKYKYIFSFLCFMMFVYLMLRLNLSLVFPTEVKTEIFTKEKG